MLSGESCLCPFSLLLILTIRRVTVEGQSGEARFTVADVRGTDALPSHCAAIDESRRNIPYAGRINQQPQENRESCAGDGQQESPDRETRWRRHTAFGARQVRFGISRQRIGAIVSKHAQQDNERERELRRKYHDLEGVARKPPARRSAIGKIIYDETGEVVRNESVRVAAVREQRMLIGEMRKEEDRKEVLSDAEQQAQVQEVISFMNQVLQRNDHLERLLARYERESEAGVIDAEVVPDLPPDAVPALVSLRDQFAAQLP